VREREDANRTREAGNRDEVEGVVANSLKLFRREVVGFIDWLDPRAVKTLVFANEAIIFRSGIDSPISDSTARMPDADKPPLSFLVPIGADQLCAFAKNTFAAQECENGFA
jgi:hypothetical protein